jgi:hypothetical protein
MSEAMGISSRTLQKRLLLKMRDRYPNAIYDFGENHDDGRLLPNLMYLSDHDLCKVVLNKTKHDILSHSYSTITAKGIDFLEDDGGLSAVLGVVTIKFHADTIRELLANKIEQSPIAPDEKSGLRKAISALPEAALRLVATDLLQKGLQTVPDLIGWIRPYL